MNTEKAENHSAREPGELCLGKDRNKLRRRRNAMKQIGGVAAALIAAGVGGYLASDWLWGVREYNYGGIVCDEVMPLLRDYHAKSLDVQTSRKIAVHLEKCPNCGPAYQRLVKEMDATVHRQRRPESRQSHFA